MMHHGSGQLCDQRKQWQEIPLVSMGVWTRACGLC
jgi:hypothetical protein